MESELLLDAALREQSNALDKKREETREKIKKHDPYLLDLIEVLKQLTGEPVTVRGLRIYE